jgi:hypothetical protein
MLQSTRVTAPMAEILQTLGIPLPKRILDVSESARTTLRAEIHASQTPCVSY